MMNILILCTGNSARSQMAEGILKSFDSTISVKSAGTNPARQVHPFAITVMREIGIDISGNRPKNVDMFLNDSFDFVITVCDNARETCPVFLGRVKNMLHLPFEDPSFATGSDEYILSEFRRIRDEIKIRFHKFYMNELTKDV